MSIRLGLVSWPHGDGDRGPEPPTPDHSAVCQLEDCHRGLAPVPDLVQPASMLDHLTPAWPRSLVGLRALRRLADRQLVDHRRGQTSVRELDIGSLPSWALAVLAAGRPVLRARPTCSPRPTNIVRW